MTKLKLTIDSAREHKAEIEEHSEVVVKLANHLVDKYCADLDKLVADIEYSLSNDGDLNTEQLRFFISFLPTQIYFANNALEDLGIESDMAKMLRLDLYNEAMLGAEGTVSVKSSTAQKAVVNEQLIENAFARAYKKAKARIDHALELQSALKKVLQSKIVELEVTRNGV